SPVLTDVKVKFDGFDAYDIEPKTFPDVLADRPVVIQGKYRGDARGFVDVGGLSGQGPYEQRFDVSQVKSRPEQRALSYLWARSRMAVLSVCAFGRRSPQTKIEITTFGLHYNWLTEFPWFVAVSRHVATRGAPASDVKQPLALPAGVEASAIAEADSADE